jgi:hypothetical protein
METLALDLGKFWFKGQQMGARSVAVTPARATSSMITSHELTFDQTRDAYGHFDDHAKEWSSYAPKRLESQLHEEITMSSAKQKAAAKRNVKKAAAAAKSKKSISHLSKATRTALGKQGAKVAEQHRRHH